jgi:hypothetical protein
MLKYWKIKNISKKPVNFVCAMPNSGSKGVLLQPEECVITHDFGKKTSTLGVQERRKLIQIEENFNNDLYNFSLYENLNESEVADKAKFFDAEKAAEGYMKS